MTSPTLFDSEVESGAQFSPCRNYRYALWRTWEDGSALTFIGLNPSTADEHTDDHTIRRCVSFAKREGYGGVVMLNLFSYRATSPKDLLAVDEPDGPDHWSVLAEYLSSDMGKVVAAWGVHGTHRDQAAALCNLPVHGYKYIRTAGEMLWCLGRTRDGHPRHPLYIRGDTPLVRWTP